MSPSRAAADLESFSSHALTYRKLQTHSGYGRVGVFINSAVVNPLDRLLSLKASCTSRSNILCWFYSRSSIELMPSSSFIPKFSVCSHIVVPHAAHTQNHVVRVHRLHCSPVLPTPPVRVLDTSSHAVFIHSLLLLLL